ncbi:MAG: cation:proton antiporter [Bryobacterales bacterium]|nr:cation:proton antiporter [Bryobacterales bacterium]
MAWMSFGAESYSLLCLFVGGADAAKIPLAMLLVFGSAKLLAELFERLGQPGIVGEILAGVLIGPSVLGWIAPSDFLTALSELGVMFLLFRVGLEVKSSELMRVGGTAALTAVLGVVVPFFLGWGILLLWGAPQIEALFVGAAMVATSVGITAQVLAVKGLLQERSSKIILAAAVIDDVLGLLVLALVASLAKGKANLLELGVTAALAVGFTVIVAKWGTRTMGQVARVQEKLRVGESQFALAMILLFALSLLAVYAGVAAIIGAFLAGMALSESVGHRVHDLAHGVTELLVPFFLAGIGLHFNLRAFTDSGTILLALVILAAAVLSKFLGCGAGALRLGKADAIRVGVGMVPRGEVGMVVAQIGLGLGVIGQQVYGVVVFMAVLTTILAPPLLNLAYRDLMTPETGRKEVFRID